MPEQNIVAFAAGLSDGMDLNENTKAGIIRRGFLEILHFVDVFYPGSRLATFFEACGLSDLVTSCYGNSSPEHDESLSLRICCSLCSQSQSQTGRGLREDRETAERTLHDARAGTRATGAHYRRADQLHAQEEGTGG